MKAHTSDFKNNVKVFGRELDSIITYESNGETIELGVEQLNSISPHYEGAILKSIMRQLDIDSNVDIPLGTIINYQFGIKVANDDVEDYRDNYEYLNFGNYIVYSSEKQEDTKSYKIVCYDKMLYAMKPYEDMEITYPITINNYINTICTKLDLTFKNNGGSYANASRQIQKELYLQYNDETHEFNDMGYTFRDVLDELAQATGSTICINESDGQLEIRYIQETNDTIDGEFLKDINVNFGKKYGPVNSIVLSRSGGSDNVYLQDQQSITQNGLCEIKISDNQIMNWNDRSDYLADLLTKLDGLEYYLNDFSSTGIAYYNLCDRYTINIDNVNYSCVMFNDELNVTQGLEENIHTDMPQETETDYTKADKTDRKLNQTYLIVDKQNQQISAVISDVSEQNTKIFNLTADVTELSSEIQNISGMVMTQDSVTASVSFEEDTTASYPVGIKIYPIGTSICNLYPSSHIYPTTQDYPSKVGLVPSGTLTPSGSLVPATGYPGQTIKYPKTRTIIFHNNTANEGQGQDIPYELPDDLLYYDEEHYDEFSLDAKTETCQIKKKCKFNADGTIGLLAQEKIDPYEYPTIELTEGQYDVYLSNVSSGYLSVSLIAKNLYTDQFYTKYETDTKITQTANEITQSVSGTFEQYSTTTQMNNAITNKIIDNNNSYVAVEVAKKVDNTDYTHASIVAKINDNTSQVKIDADKVDIEANDVLNILAGNSINLTSKNIAINSTNFNVDKNGNVVANSLSSNNASITGGSISIINTTQDNYPIKVERLGLTTLVNEDGIICRQGNLPGARLGATDIGYFLEVYDNEGNDTITLLGITGEIYCTRVIQSSQEEKKKNFKKYNNALKTIKGIDIYQYNMKDESDTDKKHIGFVIGDKYKYSQEITNNENNGVDIYSFVSLCCKAIQEQQEQIEKMQKEINKLKGDGK